VLNPQGAPAAALAEIAWVLIAGAAVIFAAVMALTAWALSTKRDAARRISPGALIIGGGVVFPAVTLTALLVYSTLRMGVAAVDGAPALRVHITAEQWWWRVRYPGFETANEIRIPAGQPVELVLSSADVIHSFWVPALAGKMDVVPGRENRLRVRAERAGEFRGQCAEYCGGPHGLMAFFVVAMDPSEFEAWMRQQTGPAGSASPLFVSYCAACHTVRGTAANGTRGPDLTHIASRRTIAAGLLPRNEGTLAAWIASSQHLKPGNLMPSFGMLAGEELRSLAAYLESLR
jgi:cytochrome c oxidase subunit 2